VIVELWPFDYPKRVKANEGADRTTIMFVLRVDRAVAVLHRLARAPDHLLVRLPHTAADWDRIPQAAE
jgi:hypothetical protein